MSPATTPLVETPSPPCAGERGVARPGSAVIAARFPVVMTVPEASGQVMLRAAVAGPCSVVGSALDGERRARNPSTNDVSVPLVRHMLAGSTASGTVPAARFDALT